MMLVNLYNKIKNAFFQKNDIAFNIFKEKGNAHLRDGQYQEAEACYKKMIEIFI